MKRQSGSEMVTYVWITDTTIYWLFKSPVCPGWQMTTGTCNRYPVKGSVLLRMLAKVARSSGWEVHYTSFPEKNRDLLIALLEWKAQGQHNIKSY